MSRRDIMFVDTGVYNARPVGTECLLRGIKMETRYDADTHCSYPKPRCAILWLPALKQMETAGFVDTSGFSGRSNDDSY